LRVSRRAAFLDRDGTLVEDADYLSDAMAMRLLDGAAAAVRRLNDAGVAVVVVTNQSGIAQGLITERQYEETRARLEVLMAGAGARIDAQYHCPHHPQFSGPCDCRKPGAGLFRRAARDLDLDLRTSLYAGDRTRDVLPGIAAGAVALLVPSHRTPPDELEHARRDGILAQSLDDAVRRFLGSAPN
jgi:D-glycero-D-manno-heptose 1,7-bisphosphate phosphatase